MLLIILIFSVSSYEFTTPVVTFFNKSLVTTYLDCYLEYESVSTENEEIYCQPNGYIQWTLSNEKESFVIANTTAHIQMYKINSNLTLLSFISNPIFLSGQDQIYVSKLFTKNIKPISFLIY